MSLLQQWKKVLPLAALGVFPVMAGIYAYVNKPGDKLYSLVTDLDRAMPFVPVFAVPYALWMLYILACLIYFLRRDPGLYYQTLVTYVLCASVCYTIYVYFQTTVPRPEVAGTGWTDGLVRLLYLRDQPYNCFPSIHCFSSYLMMKALNAGAFRTVLNRLIIYSMSLVIILSTLLIKQHVILDALSAILLVEVVFWLVGRFRVHLVPMLGRLGRRRLETKWESRM
ncbi:phosphatase PAP2 family protein [Gorillibacterium sp. sgz5001074]|uniref:phosphatase PAP2 family protein n=1 Tax=Gorillibacterium sp. sgz5001074 TaxID=3446695 RepID=UPI003F678407